MSERSMGVLQEADEERARRKDNPMTDADRDRAMAWLNEHCDAHGNVYAGETEALAASYAEVRREERKRWQDALGHETPEACWVNVNRTRGEEVELARREERERIKGIVEAEAIRWGLAAQRCEIACREILRRISEFGSNE